MVRAEACAARRHGGYKLIATSCVSRCRKVAGSHLRFEEKRRRGCVAGLEGEGNSCASVHACPMMRQFYVA